MNKPSDFEVTELLAYGLAGDPSAGFDAQVKRGQSDLIYSTNLPIAGSDSKEAKASPIEWGKPVDNLFREAKLPEGWKKVATGHDMWSDLRDHKNCPRASIFFRNLFWEREAFIRFNVRYYFRTTYHRGSDGRTMHVWDCGQGLEPVAIYADTPVLPDLEADRDAFYKAEAEAEAKAKAWLKERFPNHADPNAYWDPPPAA